MGILKGKKTYITAGLAVVYAVSGYFLGEMTWAEVMPWVMGALGGASLRNSVG